MIRSRPTVVDLFAGAGLFSYAFEKVGFRVVRAIEIDAVAARTCARNLVGRVEVGDVSRISPSGKCTVLIAGPPCQGFSTLGSRKLDDPRNALCLQVVRWAKKLRPKCVVVENVAPFLASTEWNCLVDGLRRLKYKISTHTLDALDYGVPQNRRRSFTIASQSDEVPLPRKRTGARTVQEAWLGLPAEPDGLNHHYAPPPSKIALRRMRLIPLGGDKRDIMRKAPSLAPPSWWKITHQVTDAWGRMLWDAPCNTLRTSLQNASKGRYIHPQQHRVISLREAARLHSIPDDWTFEGLPTQIARQIGNSVPPSLGVAVATTVLRIL